MIAFLQNYNKNRIFQTIILVIAHKSIHVLQQKLFGHMAKSHSLMATNKLTLFYQIVYKLNNSNMYTDLYTHSNLIMLLKLYTGT